jgi:hypothetical protein
MAELDRPRIIELLDRLGADKDETVVQAARELHRLVNESGATWDELLRVEPGPASGPETRAHEAAIDAEADDQTEKARSDPGHAETVRLIERLLARRNLSETLREDLVEMKQTIADGSFDAMDGRYIRALAKRLGA